MTDGQDFVYTREWLERKLEREQAELEKAERERVEVRDREHIREVYRQETGSEPTEAQVEATLAEKRRQDTVETARANEAAASRAIRAQF